MPLRVAFVIGALWAWGCTAPLAYGRTGETLAQGGVRASGSVPIGFASTRARVTRQRPDETEESGTYEDSLPVGTYSRGWTPMANHIFSKFFSIELNGGYGLADGLELGALLGLTRAGVELRGALLGRGDEPVALAISAAVAKQLLLEPHGVELRTGLDLSLRTGWLMPLANIYIGYVPTRWNVRLPDLQGYPRDFHDSSDGAYDRRTELRLTTPVGVALWAGADGAFAAGNFSLVVIPEFVLASYGDEGGKTYGGLSTVHELSPRWSVFLALRGEVMFKPLRSR